MGIYLNDIGTSSSHFFVQYNLFAGERGGNLILYPRSHLKHAAFFRENSARELFLGKPNFKMPLQFDNPKVRRIFCPLL